jgi:hypothetical protein
MNRKSPLGRAEFDEEITDCFEDIPIKYLMAPLLTNSEPKLIIGSRGVGKTHLLKMLANELPMEIYILDKERIFDGVVSYSPLKTEDEPRLVVVDDLHYLLKAMQVIKLETGEVSESAIIANLEKFKDYAKSKDSTIVFVADEGVSGLSLRFKEEQRRRFLQLFGNCVDTADDANFLLKYGDNQVISTTRNNVLNLNERGTLASFNNLNQFLESVQGQNVLNQSPEFKIELLDASKKFEKKMLSASENVVNEFRMVNIPFGMYGSFTDEFDDATYFHYYINEAGNLSPFPYLVERKGVPVMTKMLDKRYETYKFTPRTQFASFRQLKILYDVYGEISMEKLNVKSKESYTEDITDFFPFESGMKFNISDLHKIVSKLQSVIKKTIGEHSFRELARRLSDPNLDPLKEYLLFDLNLE